VAFELLFRDGESNFFPNIDADKATSKIIVDNQLTLGINEVTDNLPAFINFHTDALIHHFPFFLDKKDIVIEILESVAISEELINACKMLKAKGYTLALDDYDFDSKWDVFLPFIDIIKVDVFEVSMEDLKRFLPRFHHVKIQWLAEKVETLTEFEQLKELGFTLFQGYFFAKPEMLKKVNITGSKKHLIDLMKHSCSTEFDFDAISDIFRKDLGLTYKLLRFINSPGYGPSKEISSLKHALIYIGDNELKKFIALLVFADLNEGKPKEIFRSSLIRAKFCEKISTTQEDKNNPPKAFLTGMLSQIDGALNQSISDVMKILPIHEDIKAALVQKDNYLAKYLELSMILEQGDWEKAKTTSYSIKLNEEVYLDTYKESIQWSDAMLAIISK
jgi:EAL and modified HD-GYP domain-containing signal transduction protein